MSSMKVCSHTKAGQFYCREAAIPFSMVDFDYSSDLVFVPVDLYRIIAEVQQRYDFSRSCGLSQTVGLCQKFSFVWLGIIVKIVVEVAITTVKQVKDCEIA